MMDPSAATQIGTDFVLENISNSFGNNKTSKLKTQLIAIKYGTPRLFMQKIID